MAELPELPDGYEWTGRQTEVRLVDPQICPAGHPARLVRRGYAGCSDRQHSGHTYWTCACGQDIYRAPGAFVGEPLPCITGH